MLKLIVPGQEFFDEVKQEFFSSKIVILDLEHSLVSLSKWESEFKKPFLSTGNRSTHEVYRYINHMILSKDIPENIMLLLTKENLDSINAYIESTESATTFGELPERKGKAETITSELIYYWMIAFNVPFECQYWHLNRLFSLIRVCNLKNSKPKKMGRRELALRNKELNERRRTELGSSG